jgi:apolipoprotein N-acyltransferase
MRRNLGLTLLMAAALTLAFPPFKLGFLAYWAVIPFLILLENKNAGDAFRWSYLAGLIFSLTTLYWISWTTPPGAISTIVVHPFYYSLFALLILPLRRLWPNGYLIAVPFVWTAIEYVKSIGDLGFPWLTLGYTQTYYLHLIQYASYTSVYGVSFWILSLNVLLLALWRWRENKRWVAGLSAILILLLIAPYLYSLAVLPHSEEPKEQIRVGLVQGNVDPYQKWEADFIENNFQLYERLSREAARDQPEVMIWPETAATTWLCREGRNIQRLRQLAAEINAPLLTGIPDCVFFSDKDYRTYNAAALIYGDGRPIASYAKMHLVPFGERVPFEDAIPFFKEWLAKLEMGEGNWSPGSEIKLFELTAPAANGQSAAKHLATIICFESIFPEEVADFVRRGADLLVVITNDAWFGRPHVPFWLSGGVYQHAQIAIFRAIENRISIARCANTGFTMTIDPYGRVKKRAPLFVEAVLNDALPLRQETTFFTRHGQVFAHAVSVVALLLVGFALAAPRLRRKQLRVAAKQKSRVSRP